MGTAIFGLLLVGLVWAQIRARSYNPWLYWATILASTTAGTTLADFATRSLGIGYAGGTALLLGLVVASLALWKARLGTIDVNSVATPRTEMFYWITITFSQTLGTALGDWAADDGGFGYLGGAALFGGMLAIIAAFYFWSRVSHVLLFWAAGYAMMLRRSPKSASTEGPIWAWGVGVGPCRDQADLRGGTMGENGKVARRWGAGLQSVRMG